MSETTAAEVHAGKHRVEPGSPVAHLHKWWVLAVLGTAQLMVILDNTVVNIALPSAQRSLNFTNQDRQWVITAYALAFGSLLLLGGKLGDLIGRKATLIIGLIGFASASAVGGAANGFAMLVTARAVQGCFAAILAPTVLSLMTMTFTNPKDRGRAFGVFGAIVGAGAAIGLLLGGFLTEYLSWRWCMYINIVFAILALIGTFTFVHPRRTQLRPRLDIAGVLTVSAGLFSLVYGLSNAVQNDKSNWNDPVTIGFLIAAAILLVAFVVIESKVAHPLLPLRIPLDRYRGGALLTLLIASAGMFGVLLFFTYYLQETLHYTALQTGIAFLPMVAGMITASISGNVVLVRRVSPRILIPGGLLLGAISMVLFTRITPDSSYAGTLLLPLILLGIGLGSAFPPSINLATLGLQQEDAGVASASVNTGQQIGGAIGTALLNTLAIQAALAYVTAHKVQVTGPAEKAKGVLEAAKKAIAIAAQQGPAQAAAAKEKWAPEIAHATATLKHAPAAIANLTQNAAMHSYTTAFWSTAGIFAGGVIVTALILRTAVPAALKHHEHEGGSPEPVVGA